MAGALKAVGDKGATLPVVVPYAWVDLLNGLARERGIPRSELVRGAIASELLKAAHVDGQTTMVVAIDKTINKNDAAPVVVGSEG